MPVLIEYKDRDCARRRIVFYPIGKTFAAADLEGCTGTEHCIANLNPLDRVAHAFRIQKSSNACTSKRDNDNQPERQEYFQ